MVEWENNLFKVGAMIGSHPYDVKELDRQQQRFKG